MAVAAFSLASDASRRSSPSRCDVVAGSTAASSPGSTPIARSRACRAACSASCRRSSTERSPSRACSSAQSFCAAPSRSSCLLRSRDHSSSAPAPGSGSPGSSPAAAAAAAICCAASERFSAVMVCALFGFAACCQPWLQDLAPTCLGSLLSPLPALSPVAVLDGRGQVAWNDRCRRLGARRQGFPQCPCRRSHLVLKFAVALLPAAEGLCVRGSPGACEDDLAQQRRVSGQTKPVAILKRFLTPPRCVGCLPPRPH